MNLDQKRGIGYGRAQVVDFGPPRDTMIVGASCFVEGNRFP
jgi:hypothetical protein